MTTEINLSEKRIMYDYDGTYCFVEEDIKEFIRLLKEKTINYPNAMSYFELCEIIDKLAGKKLC
jgi:hypothetical protein